MTRRSRNLLAIASGTLLAIALALLLVSPAAYFRILGFLRHEAVYDGRPTSYWLAALKKDPFLGTSPPRNVATTLREGGAQAVPVLLEMLHDRDANVRQDVLFTLSFIKPAPEVLRPALLQAMRTEELSASFDREVYMLQHVDQAAAVLALLDLLQRHPAASYRIRAAELLRQMSAPEAAPGLRAVLHDREPLVCVLAAEALLHCDPPAIDAIPVLAAMLGTADVDTRGRAVNTLVQIGRRSREAVRAALLKALGDPSSERRKDAVTALCLLAPDRAAYPALLAASQDPVAEVRAAAVSALRAKQGEIFGPKDQEITTALFAAVHDVDAGVRRSAVHALGEIGPRAADAVSALAAALSNDDDEQVRIAASQSLWGIGSRAAPAIPGASRSPRARSVRVDTEQCSGGALAAWTEGPPRRCAGPDRRPTYSFPIPPRGTVGAGQLGPEAEPTVPGLVEILTAEPEQREQVIAALSAIGPGARAAVPALTKTLDKKERFLTRCGAAEALWNIDRQTVRTIPVLVELLLDQGAAGCHWQSAKVLGRMGPKAKAAVPALLNALRDSDERMREAFASALKQIDPNALLPLGAAGQAIPARSAGANQELTDPRR